MKKCECELRDRAWNPNTGKCQTCGAEYWTPECWGSDVSRRGQGPILVYIAGPFTSGSRWGEAQNIHAAEALGREVALLGLFPIVPHELGRNFGDEQTSDFWYAGTLELMRRCDAVILTPAWASSKGAVEERRVALELGLPVFESLTGLRKAYVDPVCQTCKGTRRVWSRAMQKIAEDTYQVQDFAWNPCPDCEPEQEACS